MIFGQQSGGRWISCQVGDVNCVREVLFIGCISISSFIKPESFAGTNEPFTFSRSRDVGNGRLLTNSWVAVRL